MNLEEFKMSYPKKTDIKIYEEKQNVKRRQELLDNITKHDTNLPEAVLHEDLDLGMLEFVKENFKVLSDGEQIPIIPKILTVQRWGEISNNWEFSDSDGNMKVPFIGVIRKPDVQPGTNPSLQRTIPERQEFHYSTVKKWDGNQMTAEVYKIPQPVAIDIGFEVTIICQKVRDLNRLNKVVLQKFASRQAYTMVKGHYVPILLETISDSSPIDSLDARRYYIQTYQFLMLGFLIDPEEFEIKPAISRTFLLHEFLGTKNYKKRKLPGTVETSVMIFEGDGQQTVFSVGETIGVLFFVTVNGLVQTKDEHYYWIGQTSRITFTEAPTGQVMIVYYPGKSNVFKSSGVFLYLTAEHFIYDGSTLTFTVNYDIKNVLYVIVNGLVETEAFSGYVVGPGNRDITFTEAPYIGSNIGISYLR